VSFRSTSEQRRQQGAQLRQNLERATYEAGRAERQYHAVEPENRLVARSLEQRWETALGHERAAQEAHDRFHREKPIELADEERHSLEELSRDIPALWRTPETTSRQRQEIVRCLIQRVTIAVSQTEQQVSVAIRWSGGQESRHEMRRTVCSYEQLDDFEPLRARLAELRRAGWRSPRIAEQLNLEGFRTPKQCAGFTADVVRHLFPRLGLGARGKSRTGPEPPLWSAEALARRLEIPVKKLKDWVRCGWVQAIQRPFGVVWILHAGERELEQLERRVALCRKGRHYPPELVIASRSEAPDADKLV
jgi:hypothetical protein